jgi:hypothetical protein
MLNCRQVTRLVSQSMDARLPWFQRLGVRFHLLYCVWCRRYASQVQFLRKAVKGFPAEAAEEAPPTLSAEAKAKMRQCLAEAQNNPPSPPR